MENQPKKSFDQKALDNFGDAVVSPVKAVSEVFTQKGVNRVAKPITTLLGGAASLFKTQNIVRVLYFVLHLSLHLVKLVLWEYLGIDLDRHML